MSLVATESDPQLQGIQIQMDLDLWSLNIKEESRSKTDLDI